LTPGLRSVESAAFVYCRTAVIGPLASDARPRREERETAMALPKRRISRARRGNRRLHQRLERAQLVACSNCGTMILPHHVCSSCGYYRTKQTVVGKSG
jgi:large subunit ribosomal protein L32